MYSYEYMRCVSVCEYVCRMYVSMSVPEVSYSMPVLTSKKDRIAFASSPIEHNPPVPPVVNLLSLDSAARYGSSCKKSEHFYYLRKWLSL